MGDWANGYFTELKKKPNVDYGWAVKGSIPARQDANPRLYNAYLKSALRDWKTNKLAGSLTHGVVASNAWNTAIDTALGQFLQSKNAARFQAGLAAAAKKYR
jgi:glucose/mannose transport system substrate-binding protein